MNPLLEVKDLTKSFPVQRAAFGRTAGGIVRALNGVSFSILPGETLALVGESGCGKSTAARAVSLLYRPDRGEVRFRGESLMNLPSWRLKRVRRDIQTVFQDPYGSLNPRLPISAILGEPFRIHHQCKGAERRDKIMELLDMVGLEPEVADRYPHEFSGGQRQRIAIARALALDPALIVADEPLSALDVSVQSQILNLLLDLKESLNLAFLFISHDLAVVDWIADRIAVMYLGRIVENAPRKALFDNPMHPYTQALLDAVPKPGMGKRRHRKVTAGEPANPANPPSGCPFHPRCIKVRDICREIDPALVRVNDPAGGRRGHMVSCHLYDSTAREDAFEAVERARKERGLLKRFSPGPARQQGGNGR